MQRQILTALVATLFIAASPGALAIGKITGSMDKPAADDPASSFHHGRAQARGYGTGGSTVKPKRHGISSGYSGYSDSIRPAERVVTLQPATSPSTGGTYTPGTRDASNYAK